MGVTFLLCASSRKMHIRFFQGPKILITDTDQFAEDEETRSRQEAKRMKTPVSRSVKNPGFVRKTVGDEDGTRTQSTGRAEPVT